MIAMIASPKCVILLSCFSVALGVGTDTDSMAQARTPQILEVSRDYLKPDAVAANRKLERRAEDLCRTLGFTHPYLTIESVSGPAEMWYLNGFDSEAEVEKLRREYQQSTKLLAALGDITRQKVPLKRLESTNEFVNYRADLSCGFRIFNGFYNRYDSSTNYQFVSKLNRVMRRMTFNATSIKAEKENKKNDHIVVRMEHLTKTFGHNHVLRDINLVMNKGENLVILGKSGTGKSVLIKSIVGLVEIDEGKLVILGQNISQLKDNEQIEIRKKIGFLFQSGALYDSMTVRENLEFPLRRQLHTIPKDEMNSLVKEALLNVGLADTIDLWPSELSGGMRKRLGLARTLILKPELMLYDEPTTGLDPITSKEISHLILEVQKKYNTSSIIITHDIGCTKLIANRIIVLKDGICAAEGSYTDLKNSADAWIRSFFE